MVKNVFFLIFSRMKMQIMHKKSVRPTLEMFFISSCGAECR